MAQRIKTVQESDLRMLGNLARNIQRVLPVTQADIDAAAALGKGWVVTRVFEVSDPLDNLRGGTQLVIRQNSILPGQSVRRVLIVSGPGGQTVVIRGTDYIVLPDAIANSLSYVKAFGGTEQRNIPQPYTQVNYVTNTAQTAVNTGIMIDFAKNYEFELECRAVGSSWYILQSRASSTGNITGIHGATSGNTITLVVGNVTVCTSAITRTVGNKLYVKATLNAGTATLYVKDETANTEDTQTGSYGTTQPNPTAAVYLLGNAGGQYVDVNSDIYMARIKENDTVVMDYVPARQVATAGFYDKASGTFKTAETPANLSADGNTVPTPDAPMDIVSNNGVLKVRHQSGLPFGYTQLEYLQSDGASYLIVPYRVNNKTVFYARYNEIQNGPQTANAVFGVTSAPSSTAANNGILRLTGPSFNRMGWGDTASGSMIEVVAAPKTLGAWYEVLYDQNKLYQGGTLYATSATDTSTVWSANYDLGIFARNSSSVTMPAIAKISSVWAKEDGVYKVNLVPAKRNSDNVLGMYDLVSGQFLTNQGTGDFIAGNPVSDPVVAYADGTVETINVHGKNLFDMNWLLAATGWTESDGVYSGAAGNLYALYKLSEGGFPLSSFEPNTRYTISGYMTTTGNPRISIRYTDGTVSQFYGQGLSTKSVLTSTSGKTIERIYFDYGGASTLQMREIQFEKGTTATDYRPCFDGGTATAEMLLKVDDYQDVQSILDGVVTRKVGIKVFNGTENWTMTSGNISNSYGIGIIGMLVGSNYIRLCSHFKQNTVYSDMANGEFFCGASTTRFNVKYDATSTEEQFKQWLADQYAAGTPVIIVYPLATPTTESVTGQTLQVTDGDNTLEITQASLSGLELEAEYQAAVSLTIQEVEDANLDNNVEVTIS